MWIFMVKWLSVLIPRFLTESDVGTDALPIVTDSGKEEERELDFLPEETIIASVVSSLSLSVFTVIHVLTSSMHFSMERRRSGNLTRGRRFLELRVIGAWVMKERVLFNNIGKEMLFKKTKTKAKKNTGPRTAPCGQLLGEHRMRWKLAQRCGSGHWQIECGL